jgi:hypothetical protein
MDKFAAIVWPPAQQVVPGAQESDPTRSLQLTRAQEHLAAGNKIEARDSYIASLVLRPRDPLVLQQIRSHAAEIGVKVIDEPLVPRAALARKPDGDVMIVLASQRWYTYGLCKYLWQVDSERRAKLTGQAKYQWSALEEQQCFASLVAYDDYLRDRTLPANHAAPAHDGFYARDPAVDRLRRIQGEGLLSAFVQYEIAPRMNPDSAASLNDADRAQLRRYIERYVVVAN